MSTFLQIERDGGIVTVRMNHPETRNALTSPEQIQEFVDLCAQLRSDRTARRTRGKGTSSSSRLWITRIGVSRSHP